MKIDKDTILQFLRQKGQDDKVGQAEQELPDQVDTEEDSGLLSKFGIDIDDLKKMIPGGLGDKIPDSVTDKLGGLLGGDK